MATFGQMQEFHPDAESIEAYLDRADMYFLANDIPAAKQVPVFLSVVGAKTHALLRDLFAPQKLQTQKLKEIYKQLCEHFEPQPLVIAERFYFHQRSQGPSESVAEYLAELRRLATHCKFADFLNDALRDRLVCGLRNASIQKRLLSEKDLTLKKAIELAQSVEAAESNAKKLQVGDSVTPVFRMDQSESTGSRQESRACYRCGGLNHSAAACRFRDTVCNKCKKRGHIARACRGERSGRGFTPATDTRRQQYYRNGNKTVHNVEVDYEQTPPIDQRSEYEAGFRGSMFRVGGQVQTPIVVPMAVNNKELLMELDTGAAVSVISSSTHNRMFPECPLLNTSAVLTTYTGEQMSLAGEIKVKVSYGKQMVDNFTLFVVEGDGPSLMGRDVLQKIKLDWSSICTITSPNKAQRILDKFSDVFEEGLGEMNTFTASLQLKPGVTPRFVKARPVPFALKQAIEQELDRLEEAGIVEKVTHSKWASHQ